MIGHLGACDTHMHVYDSSYDTSAHAVVLAADASVDEYIAAFPAIKRVIVVQPSAYGLDNRCQLAAMAAFDALDVEVRGVMVIDAETPTDEIERLHALGVRGARFHMLPGGAVPWSHLESVADRVAPLGWHVQLQLNGRELPHRVDRLLALRCPLVVDHVGRFMPPVPTESRAFDALTSLVTAGAYVKLSAPYESSTIGAPDYADVAPLVAQLIAHRPTRMLWATNWPHPGQPSPPTPHDLDRLLEGWIPERHHRQILVDNPNALYDF